MKKIYPDQIEDSFSDYQLCYVDDIPSTYNDYDELTYRMMETSKYKEYLAKRKAWYDEYWKTHHSMSSSTIEEWERANGYYWRYNYKDYPDPDYIAGYTQYLYFTNNMNKQWGDDWDDAPYEYNAGLPYNDETDVIEIPVNIQFYIYERNEDEEFYDKYIKNSNYGSMDIRMPKDYGYNSPFSVDLINAGAIPWIFGYISNRKTIPKGVSINAGDTVNTVMLKIEELNKMLYE